MSKLKVDITIGPLYNKPDVGRWVVGARIRARTDGFRCEGSTRES